MPSCELMVVGSYPPVPGPATAATLGAVNRGWDRGCEVRMVGYRTGAAPLSVPIVGVLAGRRLEQARRHLGCPPQLVICLQPGVPFSDPEPAAQLATAAALALAMRRFDDVTVVVTGDLGVTKASLWLLARSVDHWSVADEAGADRLVRNYGVRRALISIDPVEPYPPVSGPGLFEPGAHDDVVVAEVPAGSLARRALARLKSDVSRAAGRARSRSRAVLGR
ncbi:MAG: hypothetical protein ACP5VR_02540 [Acidimicrobiales bacterium]